MADGLISDLVAGITSSDPNLRMRSADEVTDIHRGVGVDDVHTLAAVLVEARLVESAREVQEAQLHALAELAERHELPVHVLGRLASLDQPTGDLSQDEYLAYLLDSESA